jgi:hypothetical protein
MQVNTPVFYIKNKISSCIVHIDQLYIMYVCVWYENKIFGGAINDKKSPQIKFSW